MNALPGLFPDVMTRPPGDTSPRRCEIEGREHPAHSTAARPPPTAPGHCPGRHGRRPLAPGPLRMPGSQPYAMVCRQAARRRPGCARDVRGPAVRKRTGRWRADRPFRKGRTEKTYDADIVVAGGGHNSLLTACCLAKAGYRCLVLDARAIPGGGAATEELLLPGFGIDTCATGHTMIGWTGTGRPRRWPGSP